MTNETGRQFGRIRLSGVMRRLAVDCGKYPLSSSASFQSIRAVIFALGNAATIIRNQCFVSLDSLRHKLIRYRNSRFVDASSASQ